MCSSVTLTTSVCEVLLHPFPPVRIPRTVWDSVWNQIGTGRNDIPSELHHSHRRAAFAFGGSASELSPTDVATHHAILKDDWLHWNACYEGAPPEIQEMPPIRGGALRKCNIALGRESCILVLPFVTAFAS